jgi:hypothetical protein
MLKRCSGRTFGRHWPARGRHFNFRFHIVKATKKKAWLTEKSDTP